MSHKTTQYVFDIAFGSFSGNYHLIDVNKMIGQRLVDILASFFGLCYHFAEILPKAVSKQFLEVSCAPAFCLVYHTDGLLILLEQGPHSQLD